MTEKPLLLLVVSTSRGEADAYVRAAQQAGAQVACIAREKIVPSETDVPLPVPGLSVEEAVTVVDEWGQRPTGVLGVGLMGGVVAAHLNVHFGLDGHTPGGIGITANRERMLRRLGSADLELPEFRVVMKSDWNSSVVFELQPPFLLNPAIRRDVESRLAVVSRDEALSLLDDTEVLLDRLGSPPGVVVEELPRQGKTLIVTGITHHGHFYPLAFVERVGPQEDSERHDTWFCSPSTESERLLERVCRMAASACSTIGLDDGPVQAVFHIDEEKLTLTDVVGHPPSVSVGRTFRFGKGYTLEEVLVRHSLRIETNLEVDSETRGVVWVAARASGTFDRLVGVDDALTAIEAEDAGTSQSPGEPASDKGHIWVSGRGSERKRLEEALQKAANRIRIQVS